MATFYICRHGETENNRAQKTSGWVDTPLTEQGIQNIQAAASRLKNIQFDAIYASDLGRAFITAYLLARNLGIKKEIIRAKNLREASYGDLANMLYAEAEAKYPDLHAKAGFRPPGGESLAQMQQRALTFLQELSDQNPDKTILLVSHHGVINALYANFSGQDIGTLSGRPVFTHDFVAKLTLKNGKVNSFTEIS
jgi:broad specificity phosphatase PhoE